MKKGTNMKEDKSTLSSLRPPDGCPCPGRREYDEDLRELQLRSTPSTYPRLDVHLRPDSRTGAIVLPRTTTVTGPGTFVLSTFTKW